MRYHDYTQDPEYILSHKLDLDDTFEFRCRACGKCCKHRSGLALTAYDVFRIAQFFGRTTEEIIGSYCELAPGAQSRIPMVLMHPIGPEDECPFLRNRRCVIHEAKPAVCSVFPLGRCFDTGDKPFYFLQPDVTCGRKDGERTTTVRKWIGAHASEESQTVGRLWSDILFALTDVTPTLDALARSQKPGVNSVARATVSSVLRLLYMGYDIKKDFYPQLQERQAAISAIISETRALKGVDE